MNEVKKSFVIAGSFAINSTHAPVLVRGQTGFAFILMLMNLSTQLNHSIGGTDEV
jgi:hypothetical protein